LDSSTVIVTFTHARVCLVQSSSEPSKSGRSFVPRLSLSLHQETSDSGPHASATTWRPASHAHLTLLRHGRRVAATGRERLREEALPSTVQVAERDRRFAAARPPTVLHSERPGSLSQMLDTMKMMPSDLRGATVLAFESRRAAELESLIRRHGGLPVVIPSMREVPLEEHAAAFDFLRRLESGEIDVVITLTGVGVRTLVRALAERCPSERLTELLGRTTLVARGPKPIVALRALGLMPQVVVTEPNTWREILAALDADRSLQGLRVVVQEYGKPNPELIAGLEARGATVLSVPVYVWALPEDTRPLEEAVRRLASAAGVDFVLFLSATQVDHAMQTADELGLRDAVLDSARRSVVVASIGPVCSKSLREHGLPVDLEPDHPKMGSLVVAVARGGSALLRHKRAQAVIRRP
jgi:uroporphyrinogen-III synthase